MRFCARFDSFAAWGQRVPPPGKNDDYLLAAVCYGPSQTSGLAFTLVSTPPNQKNKR